MNTESAIEILPASSFMETFLEYSPFNGLPVANSLQFLHQFSDGRVALVVWPNKGSSICYVFEDPDSSTGWTRVDQPVSGAMRGVASFNGVVPQLFAYSDDGSYRASLTGSLGAFQRMQSNSDSTPGIFSSGQATDGCRFLFEIGSSQGVYVRDLSTLELLTLDDTSPFGVCHDGANLLLNLPTTHEGAARCVFVDPDDISVTAVIAVLGANGIMHTKYQKLPFPVLPSAAITDGAGGVEFFYLYEGSLCSCKYAYDATTLDPLVNKGQSSVALSTELPHFKLFQSHRYDNGAVELLFRGWKEPTPNIVEIWSLSRPDSNDAFGDLVYLTSSNYGGNSGYIPSSPTGRKQCLLIIRPGDGCWELWRRNSGGNYDVSVVSLELNDVPESRPTMRFGVTINQGGLPMAGLAVNITSSYGISARINGRNACIGNRSYATETDENGKVWVNVPVQGTLALPTINLSYPGLSVCDSQFECDVIFRDYLANVTADQLSVAKDPRDGNQVLPNPRDAEGVANSLNSIMKMVSAVAHLPGAPLQGRGRRRSWGATALPYGATPTRRLLSLEKLALLPCWSLARVNGVLTFSLLTPDEAAAEAAAILARPTVPVPENFFDDAWDFVVSSAEAVWDGAVEVSSIAWKAARITVALIIDGIEYAFSGIVDTVERALDAVNFVFNAAGTALGTALGWLLDQLGFLFDWTAIKSRRDQFRNEIRAGLSSVMTQLGDPRDIVSGFIAQLDSIEASVNAFVAQYGSSVAGRSTFGGLISSMPRPVESILDSPEATWFFEKLSEFFRRAGGNDLGPTIPGLTEAVARLVVAFNKLPADMISSMGEIVNLLATFASNTSQFANSDIGLLVSAAGRIAILWAEALKAVLGAVGDVLYAFWANPGALIDWFDENLPASFFSGFYRSLTGNPFSLYDAVCLTAAIAAQVLPDDKALAAAPTVTSPYKTSAICFGSVRVITSGFATAITTFSRILPHPIEVNLSNLPSKADAIAGLATEVSILMDKDEKYEALAGIGLAGVLVIAVRRWPDRRTTILNAVTFASGFLTLVELCRQKFADTNVAIYGGVSIGSNVATFAANNGWAKSPQQCLALGALQASFSAAKVGLYAAS